MSDVNVLVQETPHFFCEWGGGRETQHIFTRRSLAFVQNLWVKILRNSNIESVLYTAIDGHKLYVKKWFDLYPFIKNTHFRYTDLPHVWSLMIANVHVLSCNTFEKYLIICLIFIVGNSNSFQVLSFCGKGKALCLFVVRVTDHA